MCSSLNMPRTASRPPQRRMMLVNGVSCSQGGQRRLKSLGSAHEHSSGPCRHNRGAGCVHLQGPAWPGESYQPSAGRTGVQDVPS